MLVNLLKSHIFTLQDSNINGTNTEMKLIGELLTKITQIKLKDGHLNLETQQPLESLKNLIHHLNMKFLLSVKRIA